LAHLIEPALAKYATTTEGMFSTRWRNAPTIHSYGNVPQNRAMVAPIRRRMSDSACFGDYHRPESPRVRARRRYVQRGLYVISRHLTRQVLKKKVIELVISHYKQLLWF
jgi:hypothetical protein